MNNEPVAWMYQIHDITGWTWVIDQRLPDYEYKNEKPLYTHPAKPSICVGYWDNKTGAFHKNLTELQQKRVTDGFLQAVYTKGVFPAKTLTDEEITQVFDECYPNNADGDVVTLIDFGRAILKKASEK